MEENILQTLMNPKGIVGVVCILLIGSGILALKSMKPESPLSPYVLQILGLTFILPVVVIITTIISVDAQAVMGLLGTIVGYIFGTSHGIASREIDLSAKGELNPNSKIQVSQKGGAPE